MDLPVPTTSTYHMRRVYDSVLPIANLTDNKRYSFFSTARSHSMHPLQTRDIFPFSHEYEEAIPVVIVLLPLLFPSADRGVRDLPDTSILLLAMVYAPY